MTAIDPFLDRSQPAAGGPAVDGVELAMLRHDLHGALQAVIGGISQLQAAGPDDGLRERLDGIAASARTLGRLVGALLGEAPDRGAPTAIDLGSFLQDVHRRHASDAVARGLTLRVERGSGLPESLHLDRTMLERILDNLLANAIEYTPAGTVVLMVGSEAGGALAFRVVDDGPGLPPEALARTLPAGRRFSEPGATGLGLHIARLLTERLGGTIAFTNRASGGLEAAVRFPRTAGVAAGAPPAMSSSPDLTGVRVLLAEDNPTNQMVASQMLRALNAEVTVCADGVEALERFESQPTDLVVVDIEMPRLSGLDVIRAIRARGDERSQVPIVALTAYAMREHRERIAAAGANGLISKPITSVEALGRGLAAHVVPQAWAAATGHEAAPEDGAPVVDTATFEALCEAIGQETMGELLDKVIVDLLGAQRDLSAALDPLDRAPIRSASHILISVAGALGALRLQACARALNGASHRDPAERLAAGVGRCIAEIDAAVAFARVRRGTT